MKRQVEIKGFAGAFPSSFDGSSLLSLCLIIASVILMGISAFRPQTLEPIRTSVSDTFAPILSIVSLPFQKVTIFFHDITQFAQLQADKMRLEQENERLREWYQTALLLDSENKSLRRLLNLPVDAKYDHVGARVLSDTGSSFVKSILVMAGKKEGVEKGNAVLSGDGLIGRVIEVGDKTSRFLLVTDMNSRVPVVVDETGQHAVMAGTNEVQPNLIHLPAGSEISEGVRIITSGYGGVFPKGLPVGRVVFDDFGGMEILLFSDFDSLQIVRILREANDDTAQVGR